MGAKSPALGFWRPTDNFLSVAWREGTESTGNNCPAHNVKHCQGKSFLQYTQQAAGFEDRIRHCHIMAKLKILAVAILSAAFVGVAQASTPQCAGVSTNLNSNDCAAWVAGYDALGGSSPLQFLWPPGPYFRSAAVCPQVLLLHSLSSPT